MGYDFNLCYRNLAIMSALQLILLASHGLIALIFYTHGKNEGKIEGRIEEFQRVNG
jgi:hypothetical protein